MSECPMKFDAFECDCLWKCVMPLSKTWFLIPNARMPLTKLIFFGLFTYRFVHHQWMLLQNNAFSQFWYHLCAQVSQTVHSDVITLTPKSYCWNLVSFVNVPSATTTFSTKLTMPGNRIRRDRDGFTPTRNRPKNYHTSHDTQGVFSTTLSKGTYIYIYIYI